MIDAAALSAGKGFLIQSSQEVGVPGYSVSSAGDVNGDGFPDIVEATYRTLVGAFVAREHRFFEQTEPVPPSRQDSRSQP